MESEKKNKTAPFTEGELDKVFKISKMAIVKNPSSYVSELFKDGLKWITSYDDEQNEGWVNNSEKS